jgi:hypothetical protein
MDQGPTARAWSSKSGILGFVVLESQQKIMSQGSTQGIPHVLHEFNRQIICGNVEYGFDVNRN